MAEVQDTLTMMAGIQASVRKEQVQELDALRAVLGEGFKLHAQRMGQFDEKMLEIE